jgi:Undecaprenyl-phosphate galactose phosphotransferase WbaP
MASSDDLSGFQKTDRIKQLVTPQSLFYQKHARAWMSGVLAITDMAVLLLVFEATISMRFGGFNETDQSFYSSYGWVPFVLLFIIYMNNELYPAIGLSSVEEVRRLTLSTALLFLILITLTFLLKTNAATSSPVLLLTWIAFNILIPLVRNFVRLIWVRLRMWGEPVAIVGFPDRRVIEVADYFVKYPTRGILPLAVFIGNPERVKEQANYQIFDENTLNGSPDPNRIKTVLVVIPNWNWIGENIDMYRYSYQRVVLIRQQKDSFSLSDSKTLDFKEVIGFQICHNLLNPWAMILKRCEDLVISGLCLVFLAPLALLLSLVIRLDSAGEVFYRQDRLGKNGKIVNILKFRTMYINGDQIFNESLNQNPALRKEWENYQKLKHDPRVTRVGAFLRMFSLDELPQIWNIFKGEMSVVGPRPIMVSQKEMYGPGIQDYFQIKPGITGLWQVSGRNRTTFARRVELDMEYIQRWSLWLDIYIIFQTVKEVLAPDDAY